MGTQRPQSSPFSGPCDGGFHYNELRGDSPSQLLADELQKAVTSAGAPRKSGGGVVTGGLCRTRGLGRVRVLGP